MGLPAGLKQPATLGSAKVDAKNQKVEYIYDAYGRVTMVKRYPVASGAEDVNPRATNTYDYDGAGSSTRNIWGRLAAVSVPGAVTEHYSYTAAGLLTSKASDFGGSSYLIPTVDYSYDNEGKVTQMVYPQHGRQNTPTTYDIFPRLTLNYGYDAMGQLQKITSGSGPGVDLVNSATYNAAGQLLSSMRASAVSVGLSTDLPTAATLGLETFQYNGRNQLTEQTGLSTDINYWYSATANDGRITQKKNWVTLEEENYTYDSLGRLATAYTTGPQWGLSFVYDGFGNRLQQNVTKGTAPSTVQTVDPLTNRLNGAGFGYDSNGNMTDWSTPSGAVTASYDVENRMTQIVTPSVTETYKYGPGNLRVKKYQGGMWTYTVYGQGGEVLGTYSVCTVSSSPFLCEAKLRVYFGGRLVLNGWTGVKPDRLGSPDGTHGRVYPYGEVSGSVSVDQDETFTTYKRDVYTGLDYAQNRYYASAWGRFTTADPARDYARASEPLTWNRFTYAGNEPNNTADPNGLGVSGIDNLNPVKLPPIVPGVNCSTPFISWAWSTFGMSLQELFDSDLGVLASMSFLEQQGTGTDQDKQVWAALDWVFVDRWFLNDDGKALFYGSASKAPSTFALTVAQGSQVFNKDGSLKKGFADQLIDVLTGPLDSSLCDGLASAFSTALGVMTAANGIAPKDQLVAPINNPFPGSLAFASGGAIPGFNSKIVISTKIGELSAGGNTWSFFTYRPRPPAPPRLPGRPKR